MKKSNVITVKNAGVCYPLLSSNIKSTVRNLFLPQKTTQHWALRNISFDVGEGETVALVGGNGAGKSTLSRLLAGIYRPDEGEVITKGSSQLLSVGTGLVKSLSGLDNIELLGSYMGIDRKSIKELTPDIIEFSGIGDFIHQPVRVYSSGMRARLAFSIATCLESEILIVDETLSTGDAAFRKKARARISNLMGKSKTVILVSHSESTVKEMATRALFLNGGTIAMDGSPNEIFKEYNKKNQ